MSPLSVRVTFKQGGHAAEVGLDSAGLPLYWHAPEDFKPKRTLASADEAANESFRFLAGKEAAAYGSVTKSTGDDAHEGQYKWTKPPLPHSEVRDSIKVVTKDSVVQSAERNAHLPSDDDDESRTGDNEDYWSIIGVVFGLLCTAGVLVIFSTYALWLVRKTISHQFPLRIAGAALLIMMSALIAGSTADKMRSASRDDGAGQVVAVVFVALLILCFVAVGRGISATALPKWMSLEQLCMLAPMGRSTGYALAAGILFSPLLVAIPFLIAGCGWFPHSWVVPHNVDLFYSRAPLLDSLNIQADIYLLGFFGFMAPMMERMIPVRWLRWMIILPLGTVFFVDQDRVITGSLAAPLVTGLCTLALFWLVYWYFDLLAVLTLQLASGVLLTTLMLAQKGSGAWTLMAFLACLLGVAFLIIQRGQAVAAGDPGASIPALVDFRAEREKLQAEFSVARRAQEDMLPRTPPSIPGYSIAASCTPSLDVGGDLYDFLKLPDGRIGIGVADVSGKGVPAALYMTLTKGLLASITKNNSDLAHVVGEVNRHLHSVTRKKVFVTMALGFLDADQQVLQCVRAGHNPVVWRQKARGETTLVSPGGLGLGITAGKIFGKQLKVANLALSDGDAVVFYSDGITEAMNSELEQFGEQRLMDAVEKADHLDAMAARDSILGDVRAFLAGVHPQDDMTLVVLRVGSASASMATPGTIATPRT